MPFYSLTSRVFTSVTSSLDQGMEQTQSSWSLQDSGSISQHCFWVQKQLDDGIARHAGYLLKSAVKFTLLGRKVLPDIYLALIVITIIFFTTSWGQYFAYHVHYYFISECIV